MILQICLNLIGFSTVTMLGQWWACLYWIIGLLSLDLFMMTCEPLSNLFTLNKSIYFYGSPFETGLFFMIALFK